MTARRISFALAFPALLVPTHAPSPSHELAGAVCPRPQHAAHHVDVPRWCRTPSHANAATCAAMAQDARATVQPVGPDIAQAVCLRPSRN